MNKRFYIVIIVLLPLLSVAQDEVNKFGIKFSGFVKSDYFVDTRQTVAAREGHFLLWPAAPSYDPQGNDINAKTNTTFLAVQSRLSGIITGPDALGAKTSGLIEGDFFGQANDNINLLRLRHAYVKLNWEKSELLLGQFWNPLFVTSCFPATVSFNTGTPIQPFARNPQIRFTQYFGKLSLVLIANEQRDYTTYGIPGASCAYLKNSVMPDLHAQIHYNSKSESGNSISTGICFETKSIVPRLSAVVESNTYKVDESVSSKSLLGFLNISGKALTFKVEAAYTENSSDMLSISGFAVQSISNITTGEAEYKPLRNVLAWTDIHTNGKQWQVGVFAGFNNNLGTKENLSSASNPVYGLGTDIKMLYRVSPRLVYNAGKVRFALEAEYTSAEFGMKTNGVLIRDLNALPTKTEEIANLRTLLSAYYFF